MAGTLQPHQLSPLIPVAMVERWRKRYSRSTAYKRRGQFKRLLRFIEDTCSIRGLSTTLPKLPPPPPRTQIATAAQVSLLLNKAEPWFRCFLLLCCDLALRSGTARRVAPQHYFPEAGCIRITTKGGAEIELPVSPALASLFASAPITDDPTIPFWQLLKGRDARNGPGHWCLAKRWLKLKKQCGIPEEVHFHDLRRTAAMRSMDTTHDLRDVSHLLGHKSLSSTIVYLAHRDTEKLRTQLSAHWWTPKDTVH